MVTFANLGSVRLPSLKFVGLRVRKIRCILVCQLSIYNSFPVSKCKKSPFSRTAAHIFVSPGDATAIITQYVAWMERQFNACQTPRSMYPYLQQFLSYSNRKCKKSQFSCTAAHIFASPGDAPATITQYVAWMERQFNACQTHRIMYLSIFNSFRVIRCLT